MTFQLQIFVLYVSWNFLKLNNYQINLNNDGIFSTCGLLSSKNSNILFDYFIFLWTLSTLDDFSFILFEVFLPLLQLIMILSNFDSAQQLCFKL